MFDTMDTLIGSVNLRSKILVAITHFGTKNEIYLEKLLGEYRSMKRYEVDIVVLSNIPRTYDVDVEVRVGLPTKDPWSLPFGYKELFSTRSADYDYFIYSEDDTLIKEANIDAFIEETVNLPEDYIAGFMHFEIAPDGVKNYPGMHSHYHWDPESVMRIGDSIYAYHSNEHSACFILTKWQLRKAIDSGGFMLPPRRGKYDMLVTASTEPYSSCGMKKIVCVSRFDEFCLHHLPNVYCGILGSDISIVMNEIKLLISYGSEPNLILRGPLFKPFPLRDGDGRIKIYYENLRNDVLNCVPPEAHRVLSVGCGCGTTEAELVKRGCEVVGIPLNSIIQTTAERKGITMVSADFELALKEIIGQKFDYIVILDILQHMPDPEKLLRSFRVFLRVGGTMLVSVPNWNYFGTLRKRLSSEGRQGLECRSTRRDKGVHRTTKNQVSDWLHKSGLVSIKDRSVAVAKFDKISKFSCGIVHSNCCQKLLISGRK